MIEATDKESVPKKLLTSCGTYSWDVKKNNIQLDATLAGFLGLTPQQAEKGIRLDEYLAAVHDEDRCRVASSIDKAVRTGEPCRQSYKLVSQSREPIEIVAMGQCFRDESGAPSEFAGMIFEADSYGAHREEKGLVEHCLRALDSAREGNRDVVAYLLSMALLELGYTDAANTLNGTRH